MTHADFRPETLASSLSLATRLAKAASVAGASLLFILVACSSDDPAKTPANGGDASSPDGATLNPDASTTLPAEYTAGSRLKPVVYEQGVARLFSTWHDSQKNVDCSWAKTEGGTLRCLPPARSLQRFFTDAGCTKPVDMYPSCGQVPSLVSEQSCTATKVYAYGPAVTVTKVYALAGDTCFEDALTPDARYFTPTPVPVTDFVTGTMTPEPRGAQLKANVIKGEDGSIDAATIVDVAAGFRCASRALPGSDLVCSPAMMPFMDTSKYASEDTCTTEVGVVDDNQNPFCEPLSVVSNNLGAVLKVKEIYKGDLFAQDNLACVKATLKSGVAVVPGDPVDAKTWVTTKTTTEGTDRVQLRVANAPTGERLFGFEFTDTSRNAFCGATETPGGKFRCVPDLALPIAHFEDAACAKPLLAVPNGSLVTPFANMPAPKCGGYLYFKVGAMLPNPGSIFRRNNEGACEEIDSNKFDVYPATEVTDTFPEVSKKTL